MENERDTIETLTDRADRGASPGILSTVSGTLKVAEASVWKFVPSGGGGDLPPPDPTHLHRLVGDIVSSRIGRLMGRYRQVCF